MQHPPQSIKISRPYIPHASESSVGCISAVCLPPFCPSEFDFKGLVSTVPTGVSSTQFLSTSRPLPHCTLDYKIQQVSTIRHPIPSFLSPENRKSVALLSLASRSVSTVQAGASSRPSPTPPPTLPVSFCIYPWVALAAFSRPLRVLIHWSKSSTFRSTFLNLTATHLNIHASTKLLIAASHNGHTLANLSKVIYDFPFAVTDQVLPFNPHPPYCIPKPRLAP